MEYEPDKGPEINVNANTFYASIMPFFGSADADNDVADLEAFICIKKNRRPNSAGIGLYSTTLADAYHRAACWTISGGVGKELRVLEDRKAVPLMPRVYNPDDIQLIVSRGNAPPLLMDSFMAEIAKLDNSPQILSCIGVSILYGMLGYCDAFICPAATKTTAEALFAISKSTDFKLVVRVNGVPIDDDMISGLPRHEAFTLAVTTADFAEHQLGAESKFGKLLRIPKCSLEDEGGSRKRRSTELE